MSDNPVGDSWKSRQVNHHTGVEFIPGMYKDRLWTMRQYAGFSSPAKTNKRFHNLLDGGQTGISVAFDLPTQLGFDSDDELSSGEVAKLVFR